MDQKKWLKMEIQEAELVFLQGILRREVRAHPPASPEWELSQNCLTRTTWAIPETVRPSDTKTPTISSLADLV